MRNVSYKRVITNASAAADEITSRAKQKNRLYASMFIVLAIVVGAYVIYALSLTTYDGFMVNRNVSIRALSNRMVVNYRVKPGDKVMAGDTLFSYVNVDWVNRVSDPGYVASGIDRIKDATLRRDRLRSEYSKQKQTRDSLEDVISRAERDVYLGVATKEYAEQLQWDLFLARKELENTSRLIAIEQRAIANEGAEMSSVSSGASVTPLGTYRYSERFSDKQTLGSSYKYMIAYVDMVIVDLHARHGVLIMGGEAMLTYMPYNNPEMLDMHAKLLLNPSQFSDVENGMIFNVYAGDDYLGKVQTTYKSTFITDYSITGQDHYERDFKQQEIVIRAEFLDKSCVYAKYQVDKYPLTLTRYKWDWLNLMMDRSHARRRDKMKDEERVLVPDNN